MVNEVLQWVALGVVAFLLLGVLRQVTLLMPASARTFKESGPVVGRRVPRELAHEIATRIPANGKPRGDVLVAFVAESCAGCHELLAHLPSHQGLSDPQVVIVAKAPSDPYRAALKELPVPVVYDDEAQLWNACGITATPLVMRVDGDDRLVAKEVTHLVGSVTKA